MPATRQQIARIVASRKTAADFRPAPCLFWDSAVGERVAHRGFQRIHTSRGLYYLKSLAEGSALGKRHQILACIRRA